jgi:hypothetical protein
LRAVVAQTAIFDDLALFATWQAALKWVFGHVSRAPPPRFSPFCTHFLPFFYSLACPYYCAACCPGASSRPHFRPKKRPPGSHFAPKTRFFDETSRGQYFSNNQRITTPCSKNMSKS